jgi:hypothetical protein
MWYRILFLGAVLMVPSSWLGAQEQAPRQQPAGRGLPKSDPVSSEIQNRWRPFVDRLIEEASSLSGHADRIYGLAELADVYWLIDKDKSRELFEGSLKVALRPKAESKETSTKAGAGDKPANGGGTADVQRATSYLISLAARRDGSLAKRLAQLLTEERVKSGDIWSKESLSDALELLKTGFDPLQVAVIAEAGAPARISGDAFAWLVMQLAQRDTIAADGLYENYLRRLATNRTYGWERCLDGRLSVWVRRGLWVPFKRPKEDGRVWRPAYPPLTPKPKLASAFLDAMLNTMQRNIAEAQTASAAERENSNAVALFATYYLLPEVAHYRPQALTFWQILQREAIAGTPPGVQDDIRKRIEMVNGDRSAAERREQSPDSYARTTAEGALDRADKLADGCRRDRAYAEAAMNIVSSGEFARALDIGDKIKDLSVRGSVRGYIYYDMSSAALGKGELYDSQQHAERVDSREQRALLYVKIAAAALEKGKKGLAVEALVEAARLAKNISDARSQASVFFAAAGVLAKDEPFQAQDLLKDGIRAANRSEAHNTEVFSVLRKVVVTCPGDQEYWFGNSDGTEGISLFQALASVAANDAQSATFIAGSIEDGVTRIRAQASIVRSIIMDSKKAGATELKTQN